MSNSVAKLNISISASAGSMVASMQTAGSAVGDFAKGMVIGEMAVKAFDAVVGAVGNTLSFMGDQVKSAFDRLGKLNDASTQLGITTDALSGLQYAANDTGLSADDVTDSLTKMSNTLAEAALNGGPVVDTLRKINLSAVLLAQASPDQAFLKISDAISRIRNPMERTRIAMDLFGRSGAKLLPMMLQGSDGIKAAVEQGKQLGVVLDSVQVAKVDAAGDSIGRASKAVDGLSNMIAVQLSPYVQAAADKFVEMAASGDGMGKKVSTAFENISIAIAVSSDQLAKWESHLKGSQSVGLEILAKVYKGAAKVAQLNDSINSTAGTASSGASGAANSIASNLQGAADAANKAASKAKKSWLLGDNYTSVKDFFKDLNDKANEAAGGGRDPWFDKIANAAKDAMGNAVDFVKQGIDDLISQQDRLDQSLKDFRANSKNWGTTAQDESAFFTAENTVSTQSPSFTNQFSQEAANMIAQFQNQGGKNNIPEKQLDEQKKTNSSISELAGLYRATALQLASL